MNFEQLLALCNQTAYPEPESQIHSAIIPQAAGLLLANLQPKSHILDVGCGSSLQAAKLFAEAGHEPICLSVIDKEVEHARSQGFEAHTSDMHELLFLKWALLSQTPIAAVWLRHVIEHSPCPLLVLHQCHDITSPEALLYLEVPEPWTACQHEINPNHFSVLNRLSWLSLCLRSGWSPLTEGYFKTLTQAGPDSYWYVLCKKSPNPSSQPLSQPLSIPAS